MLAQFDKAVRQLAAVIEPNEDRDEAGDRRFTAAQAAVARTHPGSARWMLEYLTTGSDLELPPPGKYREASRNLLQTIASGGSDLSSTQIADAARVLDIPTPEGMEPADIWTAVSTIDITEDDIQLARSTWSLQAMRERLSQFAEDDMERALRAVATAESIQMMILLFSLPTAAGRPDILPAELEHLGINASAAVHAIHADPMWLPWGQFHASFGSRPRIRITALAIAAGLALLIDQVEALEAYALRLHALIYPLIPMPKSELKLR